MKFKYNNLCYLSDKKKSVNIVQHINPFSNKIIENKEDALIWCRQYYLFQFDAQPMFFDLYVYSNEIKIEDELVVDRKYTLKLKESTSRLVGKYSIDVINKDKNNKLEFEFIDGEAECNIEFHEEGIYEIDINCEFFIGDNRFLSLIDESEISMLTKDKKHNDFKLRVVND